MVHSHRAPNNRNIWQTGWRHAWPILLSAFQAPFIPLLTIDDQAYHNFTNMCFEKMPLLGAPLVPGPAVDMVLQSKANDLERAIRRLSILHTHDALVLLRNSLSVPKLIYSMRTAVCADCPSLA